MLADTRYRNTDYKRVYNDLQKVVKITGLKQGEIMDLMHLCSSFPKKLLRGEANPNGRLLKYLAKKLSEAGEKTHPNDYLLPEPKSEPDHQTTFTEAWGYPQAEQEPAQESAAQVNPHEIENLLRHHLCAFARLAIEAHDLGYRVRPMFELVKEDAKED